MSTKKDAQIFLSYSRNDEIKVSHLYKKLSNQGYSPWMDTQDIIPGELWATPPLRPQLAHVAALPPTLDVGDFVHVTRPVRITLPKLIRCMFVGTFCSWPHDQHAPHACNLFKKFFSSLFGAIRVEAFPCRLRESTLLTLLKVAGNRQVAKRREDNAYARGLEPHRHRRSQRRIDQPRGRAEIGDRDQQVSDLQGIGYPSQFNHVFPDPQASIDNIAPSRLLVTTI